MLFDLGCANQFSEIIFLLERMNEAEVKPERECFDTGHVASFEPLLDIGLLATPVQISLILRVLGGAPPDAHILGMAGSNGDLIEAAARLVELSGRAVASPSQARALLSLPDPPDRSAFPSPQREAG